MNDRLNTNSIAQQADRDFHELRVTKGMRLAIEDQKQEHGELMDTQSELIEISIIFGQGDPRNPLLVNSIAEVNW